MLLSRTLWSTTLAAVGSLILAAGCASTEVNNGGPSDSGGASGTPGSGGATTGTPGSGGAAIGTPGSGGATTGTPGSGGRTGTGGSVIVGGSGGAPTGAGGLKVTYTLPWTEDFEADPVNATITRGDNPTHWIQDPEDLVGVWKVVMDGTTKVVQESATVSALSRIVGGDVAWTDLKAEVRVKFDTVSSSTLALLSARFINFDYYYFAHLQGDGALKIRKRIGGSTTDLVTYKSNVPLVTGTWYTIGFGFQGTTVTLYYNGVAVGSMTETASSLANGGIMLGLQNGTGSFDDVKVTAP